MISPPELATGLHNAGLNPFPLRQDKRPACKGWQNPRPPESYNWPSQKAGIPIQEGIVILDLDKQKGVTEQQIEKALGCSIPWGLAAIQHTPSGGIHYALRTILPVRQGTNVLGVVGFDTRGAGRGYIATGEGYTAIGMGVFRMAHPDSLPALPEVAAAALTQHESATEPAPAADNIPADTERTIEALGHLDPGCDRSAWRDIGFALKALYQDDDSTGYQLFESWSAGEYWPEGAPSNYVGNGPGSTADQWPSFKAEGKIKPATLFYKAIEAGWRPPASFDTAAAFGASAAPAAVFGDLAARVRSEGADSTKAPELIEAIQKADCNPLQVALLAAELKVELAGAGVKDKGVSTQIDALLSINTSTGQARSFLPELTSEMTFNWGERIPFESFALPIARFPGDDVNDALYLLNLFQHRLRIAGGKFFWWSGCNWEPLPDAAVKRSIGLAIRGDSKKATSSRVRSIFEEMRNQAALLEIDPPGPRVYFLNGVLHIPSGEFTHHHPDNGNTRTLAVEYVPAMQCPQWLAWLNEIFCSEPERIELLQELIGWLLVRGNLGIEKAVLFIGPPRAGKGVILRLLKALLGDALGAFSFSQLEDPKTLASMRGKNAVADGDATGPEARAARAHNGTFKTITSDDPFSVRLLYTQETWQGQLHCKLLVLCNSVPSMWDDSGATSHRWLPLLFDRSYLGNEDPELFHRLVSELPGMATWAVNGLLRLVKRGRFDLPQSSLDQLDAMVSDSGTVHDFIADHLQVGEQYRCSDAELWDAYRQWAVNNGHNLARRKYVLKSLEDALRAGGARRAKSVKLEDGRFYRGFFGVGILPSENALNVLAFRPNDS